MVFGSSAWASSSSGISSSPLLVAMGAVILEFEVGM